MALEQSCQESPWDQEKKENQATRKQTKLYRCQGSGHMDADAF